MSLSITHKELLERLSYNHDTGVFTWIKSNSNVAPVGSVAGCLNKVTGYWQVRLNRETIRAHRLAWLFVNGVWPTNVINHKNGNKLDNRIENLEDVEQHINLSLRHKVVGVRQRDGKFYARVCKNKKEFQEGPFDNVDAAHEAYFRLRKEVLSGEADSSL